MENNRQRVSSIILTILSIALVLSLAANVYLAIERSRIAGEQVEYVRGHMNMLCGDMIVLQAQLGYGKETNWSEANSLWTIASTIKDAETHALAVANMTGGVSRSLSKDIAGSGLADFWPDLSSSYADFRNAALKRTNGDEFDNSRLDVFNNKMGRTNFPDQKTFTWPRFKSAVDRYLDR